MVKGTTPPRHKLTRPYIKSLKADPDRERFYWDSEEKGLGVRVRPSGAKSWVFQYRLKGRPLRLTIGNADAIHPEPARKQAIRLRAQVVDGKDPSAEKAGERSAVLMSDFCDQYLKWLEKRAQKPVKGSTLEQERGRIKNHVKPLLGKKTVKSFDANVDAVEQFFQDIADGRTPVAPAPIQPEAVAATEGARKRVPKKPKRKRGGVLRGGVAAAHRNTEMLGAILQYAIAKKLITVNPVFLFKRRKKKKLKPPFDIEAVKRVGAAMRELEAEGEPAVGIRACRHFILTGFRRMEGLTYRWNTLDARAHCARLEDTKTGPQIRALGQAAINHLLSFKPKDAKETDYIFPGKGKEGHLVGAPKIWGRIAKRADVKRVSIHGLRHWFSSAGAELGFSDIIIGAIIGHAKKGMTGHYATAPDSALILAADRISQYLADALDGKEAGKVVKFRA